LIQNGRNGWQYDPLSHEALNTEPSSAESGCSNPPQSTLDLSGALRGYLAADNSAIAKMRENAKHDIRDYTPARSANGAIDAIRAALNQRDAGSPGNAER
jgi:hypothetical protein